MAEVVEAAAGVVGRQTPIAGVEVERGVVGGRFQRAREEEELLAKRKRKRGGRRGGGRRGGRGGVSEQERFQPRFANGMERANFLFL